MEGNQQLAQLLSGRIQDRIDRRRRRAVRGGRVGRPVAEPPVVLRPACRRRVGRGAGRGLQHPIGRSRARSGARRRELDRWASYVRGWSGSRCSRGRPATPGNFRHLHQLFEGKSVLIAYASKKTRHRRRLLRRRQAGSRPDREGLDPRRDGRGDRRAPPRRHPRRGRASALRRAAAARRSSSTSRRSARRCTRGASRSRRSDVAELRKQADTRAVAGPAAGAGVAGHHRRRAGRVVAVGARGAPRPRSCKQRLHRQRLARAEDAAVADPHVRRAAGDRASTRARRRRANTPASSPARPSGCRT